MDQGVYTRKDAVDYSLKCAGLKTPGISKFAQ